MGEAKEADRGINADWWVADVGNSRVKSAKFSGGEAVSVCTHDFGFKSDRLQTRLRPNGVKAAVASVNPALLSEWLHHVEIVGADVRLVLQSDGSIFRSGLVSHAIETPETTGVDRVLGCLGALLHSGGKHVIVIDCGTATTINVMTADRCFHGGVIMPGRWLLAKALQEGTAALPGVLPAMPEIDVGKSTMDCIRFGISAAIIGGIREGVAAMERRFADAVVFITGGDTDFVASAFPEWRRADHVTLHGLHWFAANHSAAS